MLFVSGHRSVAVPDRAVWGRIPSDASSYCQAVSSIYRPVRPDTSSPFLAPDLDCFNAQFNLHFNPQFNLHFNPHFNPSDSGMTVIDAIATETGELMKHTVHVLAALAAGTLLTLAPPDDMLVRRASGS